MFYRRYLQSITTQNLNKHHSFARVKLKFFLFTDKEEVGRSVEEIDGKCYLTDGPFGGTPTWAYTAFNHKSFGTSAGIKKYQYSENADGSLANVKIT